MESTSRVFRHSATLTVALALFLAPPNVFADAAAAPDAALSVAGSVRNFEDGDVVSVIGDSITWSRKWHRYIHEYYVTRFPDRRIAFFNAGISGDGASGAVWRLNLDILASRPTAAIFLLGMNDVGRGEYDLARGESPETLAVRERCLTGFRTDMTTLTQRLRDNGVRRFVYCSPTPYDETAVTRKTNTLVGVNAALDRCGGIVRELADAVGGEFVDFHGPMTELNVRLQQADPAASIVGWDRIHPGPAGQMTMAYLFLKAQGAPALVSAIAVEAAAPAILESRNAVISDLKAEAGGLAFSALEGALPWPIEEDARKALPDLPFERELNQQTLRVTGLEAGRYRLAIDDAVIGLFDAEELARGVHLAMRPETPQFQQAQAVQNLLEQRRTSEMRLRILASNERWMLRDIGVDVSDFVAVKARIAEILAVPPPADADAKTIERREKMQAYVENKPKSAEFRAELSQLLDHAYETARPRLHHYALSRAPE